MMPVEVFRSFRELPPEWLTFLEDRASEDFFASAAWLRTLVEHGLPDTDGLFLLGVRGGQGSPVALLPAFRTIERRAGMAIPFTRNLTNLYSTGFAPAFGHGVDKVALAENFASRIAAQRHPVLHFDALDAEEPWVGAFVDTLGRHKYAVHLYRHFGNWQESLDGRSAAEYLAQRNGALREILRRKRRRLERDAELSFSIITGSVDVEPAIAEYERIYASSWKEAEPFPLFHAELVRAAARAGCLRLGFCRLGRINVAVQLWIVSGGRATVLKLAHDESARQHSVGSLLLSHMIAHLVDVEHIRQIDFGRGDDTYKREWASCRRQLMGLLAASPRSAGGLATTLLDILPSKIKTLLRRGPDRSAERPKSQSGERKE